MVVYVRYAPYSKIAAILVFFCFSCKLALVTSFLTRNSKEYFPLGPGQTRYFIWAESNANEGEDAHVQRIFLICISFGSCEIQRLTPALNDATRVNLQVNKRILRLQPFWNKVYNSWYISLPSSSINDRIVRCLENMNHGGSFFLNFHFKLSLCSGFSFETVSTVISKVNDSRVSQYS